MYKELIVWWLRHSRVVWLIPNGSSDCCQQWEVASRHGCWQICAADCASSSGRGSPSSTSRITCCSLWRETQPSEEETAEELVLTVPYHRNSKSYSSKTNSTVVGQSYTNSSSNAGWHCWLNVLTHRALPLYHDSRLFHAFSHLGQN